MVKRTIPCRICGKMFVPCNKPSDVIGAFNYREVACSPKCGTEYLRRVQAARQNSSGVQTLNTTALTDKIKEKKNVTVSKSACGKRHEAGIIEEATNIEE